MSSKQIRRPTFGRSSPSATSSPETSKTSPSSPPPSTVAKYTVDDFLPFNLSQSAPSLLEHEDKKNDKDDEKQITEVTQQKSPYDLMFKLTSYDGIPIIIVPEDYFNVVASSFTAGMYGLDTESDCRTMELRIIQIYTGAEVYIFPAKVLDDLRYNMFVKFLRSKDRLKIGADIDTDCYRIRRHVNMRKSHDPIDQKLKHKFTINGTIDLQSIARSLGETTLGLEDLAKKYVEDFEGNPSDLGHYNPPTDDQYVYAANDAVISLRIYEPLLKRRYTTKWIAANVPIEISDESSEHSQHEQKSDDEIVQEEVSVENDNPTDDNEEPVEELVEEPITEVPLIEVKSKRKRKAKKKKTAKLRSSGKHRSYVAHDELEEALKSIGSPPVRTKSPKSAPKSPIINDDELKSKLKQKVESLKQKRTNPAANKMASMKDIKTSFTQEKTAITECIQDVDKVIHDIKSVFDQDKARVDKDPKLLRTGDRLRGYKSSNIISETVLDHTVDRMIAIDKELTDDDYFDAMDEITTILDNTGVDTIEYTVLVKILSSDVTVLSKKYSDKADRLLAANILINMALDNNHADTINHPTACPGTIIRLRE